MSRIYFVDEPAIDRTISEHKGALERIRPERRKGLELSLTGIGIRVEERSRYVPLTLPEKVKVLCSLLQEDGVLSRGRPNARNDSTMYVQERIHAVRVVVPEVTIPSRPTKPAFSFWLSPSTEGLGQLCLMEGNGSDASNPFNYATASTYTTLQSLVHFAREQNRIGVLSEYIPNDPHPNRYAQVNDTHPPSLVSQFHNVEPFAYDFYVDPERVLQSWGCEVSTRVKIDALYQVREYGPEAANGWKLASMFGYALAVERAPYSAENNTSRRSSST
jgi:hypothetical protein